MLSNQILHHTIDGLKNITRVDLAILDLEGKVLASSVEMHEDFVDNVVIFCKSHADSQLVGDCQYFKIYDEHELEYVLLVKGAQDDVLMIGKMVVFQIENLLVAYKEKFDKENFIKNLLLDNLLMIDIYNRARKLRLAIEQPRVVFVVEIVPERGNEVNERLKAFCQDIPQAFITAVDEHSMIVIHSMDKKEEYTVITEMAEAMLQFVNEDEKLATHIAYGTIVNDIKDVSKSFKEAKMALDVGKIFYEGQDIIAYSSLGIGRLIYQLPVPLCEMFIREIFDGKIPGNFDEETLTTINKFFENSLNVSETSRQLYIHRNTLVYRLDKIQKIINLDLRVFEDAITFKIALMVVKYMNYMEHLDY